MNSGRDKQTFSGGRLGNKCLLQYRGLLESHGGLVKFQTLDFKFDVRLGRKRILVYWILGKAKNRFKSFVCFFYCLPLDAGELRVRTQCFDEFGSLWQKTFSPTHVSFEKREFLLGGGSELVVDLSGDVNAEAVGS